MKNMKKFTAVMAAASLVAATGITASAYEYTGNQGTTTTGGADLSADAAEYGHTTFSIIESDQDPTNVSFTVPLFVTMAAVNGEDELMTPDNYAIKNTSDELDIAVVSMDFTKLADATYSTVEEDAATTAKEIELSLAGLYMPAISASNTAEVTESVDIIGQTSEFFTPGTGDDAGTFKLIENGGTFGITIKAPVGNTIDGFDSTSVATPQFKVQYVVSGVDEDGNIIGAVYAGDDKVAAGLSSYTAK